jgi:Domain of unknown function (DUF222)
VSTLRSAIDELQTDDLARVDDDALVDDLGELIRAADLVHAEALRRIAEVERRGVFARDGHLSMTAWLAHRFRMAAAVAHRDVLTARALRRMPVVARALEGSEIGRSQVQALLRARAADPDAFAGAEPLLVDAARTLGAADLGRALAHWRALVDTTAPGRDEAERFARRNLHVSPTLDGMVRVDGDLDPECGETLVAALRAIVDAGARGERDHRSPAQRRADALGEVCRGWLGHVERPSVAGERPHVTVTVDLATLEARRGGVAELGSRAMIAGETARRLACDASVSRVITRGGSEPLDVGRRTPVVPASIRRALVVRDRGCAFPGCDRPPSWTDAHHVRHWAHGGGTATTNLVLLCRPHHGVIHAGTFRVAISEGRPRFERANGGALDGRAPP